MASRRRSALAAAVALATGTVAWSGGALPGGADVAGAATCGPAPAGRVAVVVVVDDGVRSPSVRCVEVPERATGYDVLIAAGHRPRIEAGFLCGIDGHPATGCANRPDFDGSYWRYFHAAPGGSWSYSNVGGGGYRMPPRCAIEGWRFSGDQRAEVAPRTAPPPVRCDAASTTTAPRPAAPPAPAAPAPQPPAAPAPPPGPPGGPPPAPAGGTTGERGGSDGRDGPGGTAPPRGPRDASGESRDGGPDDEGAEDQVDDTSEDDMAQQDASEDDAAQEDVDAEVAGRSTQGSEQEERAAALDGNDSGGAGSPLGVVLVGLLILGLVGASVVRSRRRSLGPGPVDPSGNA